MIKIYLAGGMRSDWRRVVKQAVPDCRYFDPTDHGLDAPYEYTTWDLFQIQRSDLVFVYLEKSNLSGYGLCVEVGYAYALGKTIIFVDEQQDKYFGMVRCCSNVIFTSLEDGISYLKNITRW